MADLAPRTTIPTDFAAVNADSYESGSPSSAHLGLQLLRNDRFLLANLRRRYAEAWPVNQITGGALTSECPPPVVAGSILASRLWWHPTPLTTAGEWWVRASIPLGESATAVPFVYPGQPIRAPRDSDYVLTGTGSAATYGPIPVSLQNVPGGVWLGLMLHSTLATATPATGDVDVVRGAYMRSTAADFAGLASPPRSFVRIFRTTGGATQYYGPWRRILAVSESDKAVDCDGELIVGSYGAYDGLEFELRTAGASELQSVSFFELPRSGRL